MLGTERSGFGRLVLETAPDPSVRTRPTEAGRRIGVDIIYGKIRVTNIGMDHVRDRLRPYLIRNKGRTLYRSVLGPRLFNPESEIRQVLGGSRSVLLQERSDAFSEFFHTNPHLIGHSHPVSVEVREFDWK